jgi:hypothetical protein
VKDERAFRLSSAGFNYAVSAAGVATFCRGWSLGL